MHKLTFLPTTFPTARRPRLFIGWVAALLLLLAGPAAFAQLSGTYTINSAQATGGTNYASFTAAAAALNTSGVSGPVTFSVSGGPYLEQFSLNQITGASATNRVVFNGNGRTLQYGSSTSTQRAVVTLNGADYVTIDSLNIDATGGATAGTYGWGMHITGQADNNVVRGCTVTTLTSSTSTNFAGIVVSGSTSGATTGGNNANNLLLERNTVIGGYYGITLMGTSTTVRSTGNIMRNNTVRDFYFYGVYAAYQADAQYLRNDISRITRTGVTTFYGLYVYYNLGGRVEGNRIHDPATAGGGSNSLYGLYIYYTDGTAAAPFIVANNLLYNLNNGGLTYAIYNYYADYVDYSYNTVTLDDATTSTGSIRAFNQYNGTNVNLRNNIFSVTQASSSTAFALYIYNSASYINTSNNNDLYVGPSSTSFIGYTGTSTVATTGAPTLAAWQTSSSLDANSVSTNPQFINTSTGDLHPSASALNGSATPIAAVPTDITRATRSTTAPDMGAYEFTPATNDIAVESIDSPVSPVLAGTRTVTVTIRNNGATPLTTVRLQYVLNGGTPVVQNFTLSPALASGTTRALSFTTPVTLVVGANTLTVTGSLPNGQPDANPNNNVQSTTLYTALGGTYTINKNQPTGGTNFTSFTDAATALTAAGIISSVRFNVLNGPYDEQFALGEITGASATDTVVVDGGTSRQTLTYTGASASQPAAVLLNGSDYVTIQNLIIDVSANTTYGIGVLLVGQASNNRIKNCLVQASTSSTSTLSIALANSGSVSSGTTTGGEVPNLRLENNVFSGGYYCVRLYGISTTNRTAGIRLTGNEIRDFYFYGLYLYYTNGARVVGNNIHRSTRTTVSSFYGMYVYYGPGITIENNRIHDTFTGAGGGGTGTTYAIYLSASDAVAGQENDVVNNLLYNLNGGGSEYLVYNTTSDYTRIYHNTIVDDNQANTGTGVTYGIYVPSAVVGTDVRNNIVVLTRTGTGIRYALYYPTGSTIISNYNDLYLGTGTNYNTGYYGAPFATLANWRTANSGAFDQASVSVEPQFASTATGNLQPSAVGLNNTGLTLARVPRDFTNALRNSPPDIGAYEFAPTPNDLAVVSIDSPSSPANVGVNTVTVTIRNAGTAVLNSVTLSYVLNGGTPVTQAFTLTPALASNATRQLTFTTGVVALSGDNTLTVTGSLPNGQPDPSASNNVQTIIFNQPTPNNDEPCGATALGTAVVNGSNSGATTSLQSGIALTLPACSPATQPNDVWYTVTPTAGTNAVRLALTGSAAGMVRVFTSASCSAGPFTQIFCASGGANNTSVGTITVPGLTPGRTYYVAVSGYGSSDTQGPFTIAALSVLGTRPNTSEAAMAVFPNPSATGQLTLRLAKPTATATAELVNALGQVVRQQPLTGAGEQSLSTKGLATGVYTLRVQAAGEVLTRKVVLQ